MARQAQRGEKVWIKDHTKYVWYPGRTSLSSSGEVIGETQDQEFLIVQDDEDNKAQIPKKTAKFVNEKSLGSSILT